MHATSLLGEDDRSDLAAGSPDGFRTGPGHSGPFQIIIRHLGTLSDFSPRVKCFLYHALLKRRFGGLTKTLPAAIIHRTDENVEAPLGVVPYSGGK
jgi:hypothetical protein